MLNICKVLLIRIYAKKRKINLNFIIFNRLRFSLYCKTILKVIENIMYGIIHTPNPESMLQSYFCGHIWCGMLQISTGLCCPIRLQVHILGSDSTETCSCISECCLYQTEKTYVYISEFERTGFSTSWTQFFSKLWKITFWFAAFV